MKTAIAIAALSGLAAASQAQTANVLLSASSTVVLPGESFTITATGTGSLGVFAYNLLVDATGGLGMIAGVSDLIDNPTGSSLIFDAPAGDGIGAGSGFGVDRRDASTGLLITPAPIDGVPFFTFTVTTRADAVGVITYGSSTGSGSKAALSYPDTSFPPIVRGLDYPVISFGSVSIAVVPASGSAVMLGVACLVLGPARRR